MNDPDLVIAKVSLRPVEVVEEKPVVAVRLLVLKRRVLLRLRLLRLVKPKARPRLKPNPKRNNQSQSEI